jgi:peroxiredoxin
MTTGTASNPPEAATPIRDTRSSPYARDWHRLVLRIAGVYNVLWGAVMVLAPGWTFGILGMPDAGPVALSLWQCVGMIVGVYGIGYWVAARDPLRHWPIVLVGLLGKVFGPIGFVQTAMSGVLPWSFGYTILTNDLVWWVPFTLMLVAAANHAITSKTVPGAAAKPLAEALASSRVDGGEGAGKSISELSREAPRLVVFLRHAGCTFCREALADIAAQRSRIESRGTRVILVHMGDEAAGRAMAERAGLADLARISDPERKLYASFGLSRGTLGQLFGSRVWSRGFRAGVIDRHGVGGLVGDGFQMPGVFLVRDGRVIAGHVHEHAADRPDYCAIASDAGKKASSAANAAGVGAAA